MAGLRDRRPDLRRVTTTTAVANTGMLRVNASLGFRELARRHLIQIPTAAVLAARD